MTTDEGRRALLSALGTSVWQGRQMRAGKERAIELRFDSNSLQWAEVRNPFGPARRRELRSFSVDADGAAVHSTVITPMTWPDPDKQIGRTDDWTLTVVPGTPRKLRVTRIGGATEEFSEGAWPAPTDGLTATVRAFTAGGSVEAAFCTSSGSFNDNLLFDFARGRNNTDLSGQDVMAGAKLLRWHDGTGMNRFAVTDIPSFADLGGSELTNLSNFFVHYKGVLKHPGGTIQARELDDSVEDGVWVFLNGNVGTNNFFLEVHGFVTPDRTVDEPMTNVPAGDIPFEVIIVRCARQIEDIDVQIRQGAGAYQLVGNAPTAPEVNMTLFPPAL